MSFANWLTEVDVLENSTSYQNLKNLSLLLVDSPFLIEVISDNDLQFSKIFIDASLSTWQKIVTNWLLIYYMIIVNKYMFFY